MFVVMDVVLEGGQSCERALTEATRTSYVEGRWVSDDDLVNTQYKILQAFLPADGDYSTYSIWGEYSNCTYLYSPLTFYLVYLVYWPI